MNININTLCSLFLLITFYSCNNKSEKPDKKNEAPVLQAEGMIVQNQSLSNFYQSSGNLLANEEVNLYPEVSGRITGIHFNEGSSIKKGNLIVQLYNDDVLAQLQKLKSQKQLQLLTKERQDELLTISAISKQEYDNTVTQIATIDADIAYYETHLRRLQIKAPFNGKIGLRQVSLGAVVSPSTLIANIQQISSLKLDFPIPDQYNGYLSRGTEVLFTVTGHRDTFKAVVMAIQPGADEVTRTITVRAQVQNPKELLAPGTFAKVFIPLVKKENAIIIPSHCIIPTTRDKMVAVVRDGKAVLTVVETGVRLVEGVEILHGLHAGDTVMTTGIMQVKTGMNVHISEIKQTQ